MTNAVISDEEESLISFFQVGSAFVAEYRRRVKRSGGVRAVEFWWVSRLRVYKTTDIVYSLFCTSFAINVDTRMNFKPFKWKDTGIAR